MVVVVAMSIAAVSWALSLPVPPSPKLTLVAIGQYADADGCCWPKIDTLATDTSQSRATIKRRLKELEDAGLIARFARHKAEGGRTSDEIRLNLSRKPEEVLPWISCVDCTSAPVQIEPPPGSLVNPLDESSCEPEESPPTPPGGIDQIDNEEKQKEVVSSRIERFRAVYPNPSNRPEQVRLLLAAMTENEFASAIRGAEGVQALVNANPKRPPAIVSPEKFLRDRELWEEWGRRAPKAAPQRYFEICGTDAWRARCVIAGVLRRSKPQGIAGPNGVGLFFARPLPDHALILASSYEIPRAEWLLVEKDTPDYFAWRDFVRACGYGELEAENEKIEGEFCELRFNGRTITAPKKRMGIKVPMARPPTRAGPIT